MQTPYTLLEWDSNPWARRFEATTSLVGLLPHFYFSPLAAFVSSCILQPHKWRQHAVEIRAGLHYIPWTGSTPSAPPTSFGPSTTVRHQLARRSWKTGMWTSTSSTCQNQSAGLIDNYALSYLNYDCWQHLTLYGFEWSMADVWYYSLLSVWKCILFR